MRSQRQRALANDTIEFARLRERIDEPPLERPLAAHTLGRRAEQVGVVVTHPALVGDAGEPAGTRQDAEQRNLRQRDRRRTIVDEHDVVAREREARSPRRRKNR